jgi:hypothetical protein
MDKLIGLIDDVLKKIGEVLSGGRLQPVPVPVRVKK